MSFDIGPQYPSDHDSFVIRMRYHQSWFRASELQVGYGQNARGTTLGSMLTHLDGQRGLNFCSPDVAALAQRCQAENPEGIKQDRLERNLLSSQPMCFNLFGPMELHPELRVGLVTALTNRPVAEVTQVKFEYAPEPSSDYLNDKTAFDVFIEYLGNDGQQGFIGIEAKLTEPFSRKRLRLDAPRKRYEYWVDDPSAPWEPRQRDSFGNVAYNQLWRDHMLAFALKEVGSERYSSGELFLVRHPKDSKTTKAVEAYRDVLKPDDHTFVDMPLDQIIARWKPVVEGTELEPWLGDFERRYVDLSGSESFMRGTEG